MIIGIGCDIVNIDRIKTSIDKAVIKKLLTEKEEALANQFPFDRKCEWIAGRLAAKEAIYKAIHSVVPCQFWNIEVLCGEDGSPTCTCFDYDVMISIAHEKEYAIAYAMVQTKG